MPELSDRDVAILDFEERLSSVKVRSKEDEIRKTFGLSPARYYQLLTRVIDSPAALADRPTLVYRLREQRSARVRARMSRTFG